MKRAELLFSAILVPVDYVMILSAGLIAYRLRFWEVAALRPVVYEMPVREYMPILLVVGLLWIIVFAVGGLYATGSARKYIDEFARIFLACSTGVLLIIVLIFFQRELFSSRFIVLAGWGAAVICVSLGRLIVRTIQRSLYQSGFGVRNICLVGNGQEADALAQHLSDHPKLGCRVVQRLDSRRQDVGGLLVSELGARRLDEVVLVDTAAMRVDRMNLLDICHDHHITFKYSADLLDAKVSNIRFETIAGQELIEIKRTPLDGWGRIMKRVGDTVGGGLLLLIVSPVLLLVAIAIKLDTPGPVFYRATRVGEGGKIFQLYKFRSMVQNAQALKKDLLQYNERPDGPLFKMKNDPRITRVGRVIRRTSLDELPQFWNVIGGTMSLVGPRPHEPEEVNQYQKEHLKLLAIKPGVTGLAQISGRSDLTFDQEARLDVYYIEHWSPWLDMKIFFRTPWVVVSTRAAS